MNGAPVGDPPHLYATVKLWEISHRFSHEWESVGDLPRGKKDDFLLTFGFQITTKRRIFLFFFITLAYF
jgi:hypothetical protein